MYGFANSFPNLQFVFYNRCNMFEQITGHQQNKAFLQRFLNREERPHALLFYGPEGIGKCLLAKEFARAFKAAAC